MSNKLPTQEEFDYAIKELKLLQKEHNAHIKKLKRASRSMRTHLLWEAKAEDIHWRMDKASARANTLSYRVEAYRKSLYGKLQ